MLNYPKNTIWLCVQNQLTKSSLETQITANAVVANVQLPKKILYFAVFMKTTYEIFSRNANNGICSSCKCSTSPRTPFSSVFKLNIVKSALETRLKAYTVVANVQHSKKRYLAVFSNSNCEIFSRNANNAKCSSCKCSTPPKTLFGSVFKNNLWNLF